MKNVYMPRGNFPIIDIMSRHSEYSIRDNATGSRQAFRFGYRSSQRGGAGESLIGEGLIEPLAEESMPPVIESATFAPVKETFSSSPSSDGDCPALRELLSKIANDTAQYNIGSYSQMPPLPSLPQESFSVEQSISSAPSPVFNYPQTGADELNIHPDTAPDMIDGVTSTFGVSSSAPSSPVFSAPAASNAQMQDQSAEAAQLSSAGDTASAAIQGGGAWWRQAGGGGSHGSVSSDSHMLHNTSSIERMVGGFVTNALRGGKAHKPVTRRPVSSASSSESEAESSEDEKSARKKHSEESASSESDKKKSKKSADKSDKPKRAPTAWMSYMSDVREIVKGVKGANGIVATKFASEYKKKAEASGKTGDAMYKAALEILRKEWASGVAKKKLADMLGA
jgi:hypothetical protein